MSKKAQSKLGEIYEKLMQDREISAFLEAIQQAPDTTLREIVELATKIGIEDRVSIDLRPKGEKKPLPKRLMATPTVEAYSTRTPADRKVLDERIRQTIAEQGGWIRAEAFRALHFQGLSVLQFRKSCARLVASKQLKRHGQARGTEYKTP